MRSGAARTGKMFAPNGRAWISPHGQGHAGGLPLPADRVRGHHGLERRLGGTYGGGNRLYRRKAATAYANAERHR